jgi:hypothetical protein
MVIGDPFGRRHRHRMVPLRRPMQRLPVPDTSVDIGFFNSGRFEHIARVRSRAMIPLSRPYTDTVRDR